MEKFLKRYFCTMWAKFTPINHGGKRKYVADPISLKIYVWLQVLSFKILGITYQPNGLKLIHSKRETTFKIMANIEKITNRFALRCIWITKSGAKIYNCISVERYHETPTHCKVFMRVCLSLLFRSHRNEYFFAYLVRIVKIVDKKQCSPHALFAIKSFEIELSRTWSPGNEFQQR